MLHTTDWLNLSISKDCCLSRKLIILCAPESCLHSNVTDIFLTADLMLTTAYWAAWLPIEIDRSFTVRGPNVTIDQVSRVFDMGYVVGKATLLPGVEWTIELAILSSAQAQSSESLEGSCLSRNSTWLPFWRFKTNFFAQGTRFPCNSGSENGFHTQNMIKESGSQLPHQPFCKPQIEEPDC